MACGCPTPVFVLRGQAPLWVCPSVQMPLFAHGHLPLDVEPTLTGRELVRMDGTCKDPVYKRGHSRRLQVSLGDTR